MGYPKRLRFETIREVAFGAITANLTAVGAAIASPARIVRIVNGTNQDVYFSIDGANNHIRLPSVSFILFDLTANKVRDEGAFIAEGTIFYIRHAGVAPASGNAWVEVCYGG